MVKREHPLEPVIHLVDEKGVGSRVLHMGRTASVATAKALSHLVTPPRGDDMARKMVAMFGNPKEHADYLTSPRWMGLPRRPPWSRTHSPTHPPTHPSPLITRIAATSL